jgi:hypothetical protein
MLLGVIYSGLPLLHTAYQNKGYDPHSPQTFGLLLDSS